MKTRQGNDKEGVEIYRKQKRDGTEMETGGKGNENGDRDMPVKRTKPGRRRDQRDGRDSNRRRRRREETEFRRREKGQRRERDRRRGGAETTKARRPGKLPTRDDGQIFTGQFGNGLMFWHEAEYVPLTWISSHHLSESSSARDGAKSRHFPRLLRHSPPAVMAALLI